MGKFVFNEYHIKLHGKEYDILVPSVNITEMWAFPMRDLSKCDNWDAIEGNRLAMQWVRNAYITLYQEPNKIIYFCSTLTIKYEKSMLTQIKSYIFL